MIQLMRITKSTEAILPTNVTIKTFQPKGKSEINLEQYDHL
jgi:hypothetical protein